MIFHQNMRGYISNILLLSLTILTAVVIFWPAYSKAQPSVAQQQTSRILKMPDSRAKIDSIIKFTSQHRKDSSMEPLFTEGLRIARQNKLKDLEAQLLDAYGVFKRDFSEYSDALKYHRRALEIARMQGTEKTEMYALNNIGVVFRRLDQNSEALNHHIAALKMAEKIGDDFSRSVSMNSIGNIHIALGNYPDAIEYFEKCLPIAYKVKNNLGIAMNLNNIGEAYERMNKLDSAEKYYQGSLEFNQKMNNPKGIAICYNSLGSVYKKRGSYAIAQNLFSIGLNINKQLGDKLFIAGSYNSLGDIYLRQNQPGLADEMFKNGLKIAKDINSKSEIRNAFEGLMKVNRTNGNYQNALMYSNLTRDYTDSINLENNHRHVRQMEAIYQNDNEQARVKLLETKNQNDRIVMIGSLILFALLLLTGALYYLRYRLLEKNKALKRELDIRSQIASDLHDDMGSTLSSIHIFSELLRKGGPKTEELLTKIEENAKDTLDALDDIIWLVKPSNDKFSNLTMHISQFAIPLFENKNIEFEIDFPEAISEVQLPMETRRNVFLIVKESINNLVKYSECTKAVVKAEYIGEDILFTVEDNGKGFDPNMITQRSGLKNLHARANQINADLAIDSSVGKGSRISLYVKAKELAGVS